MQISFSINTHTYTLATWRQEIAILIRMQFLNDIIKSRHGFKTAHKFHKFRVLIKTIQHLSSFKAMS